MTAHATFLAMAITSFLSQACATSHAHYGEMGRTAACIVDEANVDNVDRALLNCGLGSDYREMAMPIRRAVRSWEYVYGLEHERGEAK